VTEPEEDFAALFESSFKAKRFENGQTVEGTIVAIGPEVAFVDVGSKGEATISLDELRDEDGALEVAAGDRIQATVVSTAGELRLSRKLQRGAATAAQLERILAGVHRAGAPDGRARIEARRSAELFFDEDGMLVVRARLAPEEGATLLRAMDEARRELWERPDAAERPVEQARADAFALIADKALGATARSGVSSPGGTMTRNWACPSLTQPSTSTSAAAAAQNRAPSRHTLPRPITFHLLTVTIHLPSS